VNTCTEHDHAIVIYTGDACPLCRETGMLRDRVESLFSGEESPEITEATELIGRMNDMLGRTHPHWRLKGHLTDRVETWLREHGGKER